MKKFFFAVVGAIAIGISVFWYKDIIENTDFVTGFVINGGAITRYAILLFVLAIMFLFSIASKNKLVNVQKSFALFTTMLFSGIAHIVLSIFMLTTALATEVTPIAIATFTLFFALGCWLILSAVPTFVFQKSYIPSIFLGIMGISSYYILSVERFVAKPSSIHRLMLTVDIIVPVSVLLFLTAFIKEFYFERESRRVIETYLGLQVFFIATGIGLAQLLGAINGEIIDNTNFYYDAAMATVGLIGLASAMPHGKPAKKVTVSNGGYVADSKRKINIIANAPIAEEPKESPLVLASEQRIIINLQGDENFDYSQNTQSNETAQEKVDIEVKSSD